LRERLRAISGGEQKLLAVDFMGGLATDLEPDGTENFETATETAPPAGVNQSSVRIWGLIGSPGVSRSTREDQHLFVNRRPVENRGLNFALMEGYHTALMKGRYPVCCLFLEIDPAAVDVIIHPAKREVKFHREREIRQLTAQAVRETLLKFHQGGETKKPEINAETQRRRDSAELETKPGPEFSTPSLPKFALAPQPVTAPLSQPATQP